LLTAAAGLGHAAFDVVLYRNNGGRRHKNSFGDLTIFYRISLRQPRIQ